MINEQIDKEELAAEMKWLRNYIKANPDLRNRKEAKNKYRIKALAEKRILERKSKGKIIETEVSRLGKVERVKKRIGEESLIYTLCKGCENRFSYYKFRKTPRKFCSNSCSSSWRYARNKMLTQKAMEKI